MHLVSLGFPIPDRQVDNHSIANAPALFEYDACVLEPRVISHQIEAIAAGSGEFKTAEGAPVQAGAGGAFHYGLGELLQQRRHELARLLERGGIVLVFTYPNVPHPSVTTLPGADRYCILPAPPGVLYRPPQLLAGGGRERSVRSLDPRHPFSTYLDDLDGKIRSRAHWDTDAIPDFDSLGAVVGRSRGGAAAAVEFRLGPGRIVFLPPADYERKGLHRRPFSEAILESLTRALETPDDAVAPSWLRQYPLPGLAAAESKREEAETALREAENRLLEARAFHSEAAKYHGLLWRWGKYDWEPLVRDAFRVLGFTVSPDLDLPPELEDGDTIALLEVDASERTIEDRRYLALQRRVEEGFLHSQQRRKGVLVVNGERLQEPKLRRHPYSDALVGACEQLGYALITGDTLFDLVTYALEGADAEALAGIRRSILETDGLLAVEEAELPEPPAPSEPAATPPTPPAATVETPPTPVTADAADADGDGAD